MAVPNLKFGCHTFNLGAAAVGQQRFPRSAGQANVQCADSGLTSSRMLPTYCDLMNVVPCLISFASENDPNPLLNRAGKWLAIGVLLLHSLITKCVEAAPRGYCILCDTPSCGFRGVFEVSRNHSGFSLDDGCGPFRLQRFTKHTQRVGDLRKN